MSRGTIRIIRRLALVGLFIGILGNGILYVKGNSPFNLTSFEQSFVAEAASIQNLEVSSESDNIIVKQSTDDQFHFRIVGKMSRTSNPPDIKHQLTTDLDTVKFNLYRSKKLQIGINYSSIHLEVSIPREPTIKQISLKSVIGDIKINDFTNQIIHVDNDSGSSQLNNVTGQLNLTSKTGDIRVNLKKIEGDISFKLGFGEFKLTLMQAPLAIETKLSTVMGEIKLDLPHMIFKQSTDNKTEQNGVIGVGGPIVKGSTTFGDIKIMLLEQE